MTGADMSIECLHPSQSYYREDKLDLDLWFKVTQIDYERLLERYSFGGLFASLRDGPLSLLDLGCGTARFPCLLDQAIPGGIQVYADLLDISDYCLKTAAEQYAGLRYFAPRSLYRSALEDLAEAVVGRGGYDVIWAIHSLYTVKEEAMSGIYRHCLDLLMPQGTFLIYQLCENSAYYRLYDHYLNHYSRPHSTTSLLTSESHQRILAAQGINYQVIKLQFTHTIAVERQDLLEVYLRKCVMDNAVEVRELFQTMLMDCYDEAQGEYRFDQEVDLLIINKAGNRHSARATPRDESGGQGAANQ
jgi:SAM-dependent methyltransferase